jgi:hypothetical protein
MIEVRDIHQANHPPASAILGPGHGAGLSAEAIGRQARSAQRPMKSSAAAGPSLPEA